MKEDFTIIVTDLIAILGVAHTTCISQLLSPYSACLHHEASMWRGQSIVVEWPQTQNIGGAQKMSSWGSKQKY